MEPVTQVGCTSSVLVHITRIIGPSLTSHSVTIMYFNHRHSKRRKIMMNNNISECNNNTIHTYISSNTTVNNVTCVVLGHTYISSNTMVNNINNTVNNADAAEGGHPKRRNHHELVARVRFLKNLPGHAWPGAQRRQIATDVLVLLPDTLAYDPLGGRLLITLNCMGSR